jgi:hypothetical protein
MPELRSSRKIATEPLDFVMEVISTKEGLALAKAFMRIINIQVRRRIVDLVEEIAAEKLR